MRRNIILILLISIAGVGKAQEISEIALLQNLDEHHHAASKEKLSDKYHYVKQNTNELQFVMSGLFLFYKEFISSQDSQSCSFTPSCSEYALQAVKQQGIFKGMLNGFDRLSRCNSLSPEKYEVDPETRLLLDPLKL
ncbi:membrane protein insertion efficiency factor YidD [Marivirga atlantica]|uniref:Membrane protein insertion efficiency factor YidD n=1 Tax=Marivirga atlantica TaxID=1548457 RepID=A0A937A8P5_9BACT|nr:membrane protein insertion efficiency factor YidD [Marivirga atlantica]MBL0764396.1 membrane protein insertion efficiency factor YidD [Marivirga atlantica]